MHDTAKRQKGLLPIHILNIPNRINKQRETEDETEEKIDATKKL